MLNYSVIDKRLRKYLGTVQGETHAQCWEVARKKFETRFVRIDCYPSPPEYKGPPRLETEDVEPVVSLKPDNGLALALQNVLKLKDTPNDQYIDHRYSSKDFGFEPGEAIIVTIDAAEVVLSAWAQSTFGQGEGYSAKVVVTCGDLVVVVSKTGQ